MPNLDQKLLQIVLLRQLVADAEQILREFEKLPAERTKHASELIKEFRRLLEELEKLPTD